MGRVFQPTYTMLDKATGLRVKRTSPNWSVEYTDSFGRCVRRAVGPLKEKAKDVLRKLEGETVSEKFGLPTRGVSEIPAIELCEKFLMSLRTRATDAHCKRTDSYIRELFTQCKIRMIADLAPERIEAYLDVLATERNLGAIAINARLHCLKAMLNWAVSARLLPYNPLDCIAPREKLEKRHPRRALTEEEIVRLLAAALGGPLRREKRIYQNRPRKNGSFKPITISLARQAYLANEGRNNALAYRLMLEAGLRKSESASITWNDIDLDAGTLTTRPYWEGNKNGKEETLPLAPGLLEALRARHELTKGQSHQKIVHVTDRVLRQFKDDLVAAGLARRVALNKRGQPIPLDAKGRPVEKPARWTFDTRDASGRVVDLHALRHTFGTRLGATPGIDPKSVQTLMRHSTPNLTFAVYVHSDKTRLKSAVAAMPTISMRSNRSDIVTMPSAKRA